MGGEVENVVVSEFRFEIGEGEVIFDQGLGCGLELLNRLDF